MATYWENSCSFGLRYVSWYKYLIVSLVFSRLGFWSGNLFLIAPFPDLCLLVPFFDRRMIRLDAIRYGQIRINAFSYVPLPTITDRPSAHAFLTVMKICPRIYRALRIRYVQLRTLRMRYESLRIGRTDTEHLSAASAAYVSPSVT